MMVDEMTRLAELGDALSPDEIPMDRLRARAMTATRPRRRWVRPVAVATAVASAAVASAAAAVMLAGPVSPPEGPRGDSSPARPAAYEVTRNADGTVTFTVHQLTDMKGATEALNAAGIAGRVVVSAKGCPTDLNPEDLTVIMYRGERAAEDTIRVSSSMYPPGGGILIMVAANPYRPDKPNVLHASYIDANKIPNCVDLDFGER